MGLMGGGTFGRGEQLPSLEEGDKEEMDPSPESY